MAEKSRNIDNVTIFTHAREFFKSYDDDIPEGISGRLLNVLESGDLERIDNFFLGSTRNEFHQGVYRMGKALKGLAALYNVDLNQGEEILWTQDFQYVTPEGKARNLDRPHTCKHVITDQRVMDTYLDYNGKKKVEYAISIDKLSVRVHDVKEMGEGNRTGTFSDHAVARGLVPPNATIFLERGLKGSVSFYRQGTKDPVLSFHDVENPRSVARMVRALLAPPKMPRARSNKRRGNSPMDKTR